MEDRIAKLLEEADLEKIVPNLLCYADKVIRRYAWRGVYTYKGVNGQLLANGQDANDFVQEAFRRLLDGRRNWDPDKLDLIVFLKGTIKSLINAECKSLDNRWLRDIQGNHAENSNKSDPISTAIDPSPKPDEIIDQEKERKLQKQIYEEFKNSIIEDAELTLYLEACEVTYLPREIEELTNGEIKATRAYELKRKLRQEMDAFIAQQDS